MNSEFELSCRRFWEYYAIDLMKCYAKFNLLAAFVIVYLLLKIVLPTGTFLVLKIELNSICAMDEFEIHDYNAYINLC